MGGGVKTALTVKVEVLLLDDSNGVEPKVVLRRTCVSSKRQKPSLKLQINFLGL